MGAIRNPEAGLMEALRTLRAVPGVIAPVRLSLILLACGGTRYTYGNSYDRSLNTNFLHTVCMVNPEQVDFLIIRMRAAKHQLSPHSLYGQP